MSATTTNAVVVDQQIPVALVVTSKTNIEEDDISCSCNNDLILVNDLIVRAITIYNKETSTNNDCHHHSTNDNNNNNNNNSNSNKPMAEDIWSILHQTILTPDIPFRIHQLCYNTVYNHTFDSPTMDSHYYSSNKLDDNRNKHREIKPCWIPPPKHGIQTNVITNIEHMMKVQGMKSYEELYHWSITNKNDFWMSSIDIVQIEWYTKPTHAIQCDDDDDDSTSSVLHDTNNSSTNTITTTTETYYAPTYFPNGILNIANSCLRRNYTTNEIEQQRNNKTAIIYANETNPKLLQSWTYNELRILSYTIAYQIQHVLQLPKGSAIAICMPMIPESNAIYLGIVLCGCVVVSIADSFSVTEITTRCRIANVVTIFTQDVIYRNKQPIQLVTRIWDTISNLQKQMIKTNNNSNDDDDDEIKESKIETDDTNTSTSITSDEIKVVVLPASLHMGSYNDSAIDRLSLHESIIKQLRNGLDWSWDDFITISDPLLLETIQQYEGVPCTSMDPCNILFSSGTTGEPKAVVWTHSTPIKCCIDGYYHQDITNNDIIAWPTNIGWMMGPWLLYQLIHGATICLYQGLPHTKEYCTFIDVSNVTMLGVIPSLVKAWYARDSINGCDWSHIRRFSSTGEASDAETYHWLMSRVPGYAPVIEYCGGTEIGGSFLSSTMVQPNAPSMFSTPVLGSQIALLDPDTQVSIPASVYTSTTTDGAVVGSTTGELVLQPPSIGLSTVLLNRNHFDCYYKDMPCDDYNRLYRKHGDAIEVVRDVDGTLPYYRALGRCDDTMNIGGIKVSSVEIERVCNHVPMVKETAAIAVSSGGPCQLIVFVVLQHNSHSSCDENEVDTPSPSDLKVALQRSIKVGLNPLFGIHDVVITDSLPRTASNKIMRRLLRDQYIISISAS